MTSIIEDFIVFKSNFPKILDLSGYKMDFLASRLNMNPSTFANKKKRNSFALNEMQDLIEIVWNDYLEEVCLSEAIIQGQKEGQLTKKETQTLFQEWK